MATNPICNQLRIQCFEGVAALLNVGNDGSQHFEHLCQFQHTPFPISQGWQQLHGRIQIIKRPFIYQLLDDVRVFPQAPQRLRNPRRSITDHNRFLTSNRPRVTLQMQAKALGLFMI